MTPHQPEEWVIRNRRFERGFCQTRRTMRRHAFGRPSPGRRRPPIPGFVIGHCFVYSFFDRLSVGAGRSSYSARRRVSAPEDAYPRPGYRLRSRTTATTRRTSGGRYSYRSRAQSNNSFGGPNGLIHRLGWAGSGKIPAQPVNKSGEAIRWSFRVKGERPPEDRVRERAPRRGAGRRFTRLAGLFP